MDGKLLNRVILLSGQLLVMMYLKKQKSPSNQVSFFVLLFS